MFVVCDNTRRQVFTFVVQANPAAVKNHIVKKWLRPPFKGKPAYEIARFAEVQHLFSLRQGACLLLLKGSRALPGT